MKDEAIFGSSATGEKRTVRILDLGCGSGESTILLSEKTSCRIFAGDISEEALNKAIMLTKLNKNIDLIKLDVYSLPFRDNSFDIVVSYGYGSVASYKGAQSEVGRILKPNGIAIIDFRNLSLYELLRPYKLIKYYKRYKQGEFRMYHFGKIGIAEEFRKGGLELKKTENFNTFPPISKHIPSKVYIVFEYTIGRILRPLLARVFLAKFVKETVTIEQ